MAVLRNNLHNHVIGKLLLQDLEWYKDTQMKAYDKYIDNWRDLEMWVKWSFKVIGNGTTQ